MFTIHFDKSLKKMCLFLHKHHASSCISQFQSPSLTEFFFSKKVKSGLMSSFNFGLHMQTLAQTREMDQLRQEVHDLR